MKLRDRARRLFGREQGEHTVRATKVDHAVFQDVRRRSSTIGDLVAAPPTVGDRELNPRVWERLAEDLWSEFYGDSEPSLIQRDKIKDEFRVNREVAGKNAADESFRETRSMTRGEKMEAAIALRGSLMRLHKSYGNELAEHAERQSEIADAEDALDSIDDQLEALRQQRREQEDPAAIDEQIRQLAQQKRETVETLTGAVAEQQRKAGDLQDAVKKAVVQAAQAAEEAIEASSLLPGKGAGSAQRVSPDMMLAFADRVSASPALKAVLDMMGRLEMSMSEKRRQLRRGGYEEMVDIETGDDLRLVLPAERALLTHPIARLDFYRRFHERSLMQYEMWSELELKKGPVILGADGSASMKGAPNAFCRGLTLAACGIGNREGRNTAAIEFGSTGQLREFFFPGDRPLDMATALDFAEHFFKGGTDINQVLLRAYDLINAEAPFHSADLVIITDGGDRLTESTYVLRDKLREAGVKIHGICVGIKPTPYMVEVCDAVTSLFDYSGPNSTSDRIAIDLT